jgi:L-alanine-DL-glutamate epimerase-like enolase superfamily enzyme
MAAIRNTNYYEVGLVGPTSGPPHAEPPIYDAYTDALEAIGDDGSFPVPEGPGLGVAYDWDYIEANAEGGREYS